MKSKISIPIEGDRILVKKLRKAYFDKALLSLNPFASKEEKEKLSEEKRELAEVIFRIIMTRRKIE